MRALDDDRLKWGGNPSHIYSSLFFFFFLSPFIFIGNTFIIYIGGRHGSDILRERIGRPKSALLPLCERERFLFWRYFFIYRLSRVIDHLADVCTLRVCMPNSLSPSCLMMQCNARWWWCNLRSNYYGPRREIVTSLNVYWAITNWRCVNPDGCISFRTFPFVSNCDKECRKITLKKCRRNI
jgi:hypothetical protein